MDENVCVEFQNITKSRNFIFSEGVDFIYESFNSKDSFKKNFMDRSVKLIGKNKFMNKYFKKIADMGLNL